MKLLLFTLPKCPHCPAAEKIVEKVVPLYRDKGLTYEGKIRIKTKEGKELAKLYYVKGTPTIILINNGSVIKRFVGAPDEETLKKEIEKGLGIRRSFFKRLFTK